MTAEDKGDPAEVPGTPPQGPSSPVCRILVVDDEMANCQVTTEMLILAGYEADFATDGAAGWDAVQAKHYDLLITDNFMPKVTGVEMVVRLRRQNPTLPIIIATGAVPAEELKRHPWLEVNAFLIKPYSVGKMLRTVRRVLRKANGVARCIRLLGNSDAPDRSDPQVSQAVQPNLAAPERSVNAPRRILVVEDDGDIRRLNTEVLTRSGYQVDAAEDGAVAWEAVQRRSYDLVITDNEMPNVSGVELLRKLRDGDLTLPVIMATGTLPHEDFARHPGIQPDALLLKPYSFKDLLGAVQKVLQPNDGLRRQAGPPPNWQTAAPLED